MATLDDFTKVGNIYVDNSFTAEATPATSPLTGEALEFGVNAFTDLTGADVLPVTPEDGHAAFVTNVARSFENPSQNFYFGRGDGTTFDVYVSNIQARNISIVPRAAGNYSADSDGKLTVYIEGSTFANNLLSFGGTSNANFTGAYDITIKNSRTAYFAMGDGQGYGSGEGNAGNQSYGTITGTVDFFISGLTVSNVGSLHRGSLVGNGDTRAHLKGTIENSYFGGEMMGIHQGVDANGGSYVTDADIDITITGSSFGNAFMMLPNQSSATRMGRHELDFNGNISLKVSGSTMNGLVIGTGKSGTGWQRVGWVNGDIGFELAGSTTGRTYVQKGNMGDSSNTRNVTGDIKAGSVIGDFVVFEIRDSGSRDWVYSNSTITVTDSTMASYTGLTTINSGGNTLSNADHLYGAQKLEITGSTLGNVLSSTGTQANATFELVFHTSDKQSVVGTVTRWNTMTVDAGANVRATALNTVTNVTLNGANLLSAGTVSDVETLTVVDATLTKGDAILISGLSSFDEGNIGTITINSQVFEYGMFGGQYELVGSNLVAHLDPTYLVNDKYEGNGIDTDLGVKGYKDLSVAQAAARANNASLIYTTMDGAVDAPSFTEDISTLDVATKFVGEDGDELDLEDVSIIIGGADAVASAKVNIAYADNIKGIKLGAGTGTATVTIANVGSDEDSGLGTLDLTGSAIADADISVSDSVICDVKLADNAAATGKLSIGKSTIKTVYGGASAFENDLTDGNTIETVYAEGNGASIKFGTSTVETYIAGSNTEGAEIATLVYNDSVSATDLIVGGNANKIGAIDASVTGGEVEKLTVGNNGDIISGDVKLSITGGEIEEVEIAKNATLSGTSKVEVTLGGGTVATSNGTFYGLIYGASVTGALDGGDQGASRTLTVDGYARIGSITNFDSIEVKGGTLNVESGDRKDDPKAENAIDITGNILNKRAIQAGAIYAKDLDNHGMVGVLRSSADDPGIQLTGNFASDTFVRTSILTVDGNFSNSGEITSVGDITVDGSFSNSGQIYVRSSFDKDTSVFAQEGGIELNNADMVNSGSSAFISTGFLKGVKNLTTNRLYVTGGADITGNITIEAGAEVAFTNKANPERADGLSFGGSISMYDTSSLIVSGTVQAGKTLTINTEDGLAGSNVLVKAEAGLDKWTISWGAGLSASSYGLVRTDSQIMIYSVDELIVNSAYASLEDGDEIKIDGNTYIKGLNAFGTVEDATYFAGTKGFDKARIVVYNDKSGMDVDTTYGSKIFDLTLVDSTVGAVTAKNIYVATNSSVKSIDAATGLTIDDSALLTVSDTIVDGLAVVIDAADGSGARKVLAVNPDKVHFAEGQITVLKPLGNDSYTVAVSALGDTVFLKANANIFLLAADAEIVDGVTVDKATGDVLFAGVNAFTVEADAAAAAAAVNGTLWIADGSNKIRAIAGVSNVALEYSGSSSIYGSEGDAFVSDQDYSVKIAGSVSSAKVYGLNKSVDMSGNYTFEMSDCNLTADTSAIYIVGNNVNNVVNGNITAVLTNVTTRGRQQVPWNNPGGAWNEGIYLGYGSFGTNSDAPINVDITLQGVTSSNSGFYGIQTQPSDGPNYTDESTSATPPEKQVRQDINANINIKVYDSVIGGTFTVLNTNNDHWNADGASLLNTFFSSGSITVEVGNSDFGTSGNWRNIRLGASLQLGGKAIQEFNVPNTLHIVATENGTTTRAAYINEWDTVIVDATAQLWLNNDVQYSTVFGPDQPLDDAGTLTQIMINMSGYKSGTHNVITAGGQIYTDSTLSNITVIGDNDLTGQCQLAYAFSGDGTQLKGIYIFDKADDMYVNSTYTNEISGTKVSGQELLLNYNAYTDFGKALEYADAWGHTIVVTGGEFGSQDFHGNNVVISGATIASVTLAGEKQVLDDVTLTVKDGAVLASIDGSNDKTTSSTLEIAGAAQLGEIKDFDTVTLKKGVALTVGSIAGAGLDMYADNELIAQSVSFNGTEKIVLDVTGYTDKSHAIISTTDGISGFSAGMVELVAHDKGKIHTDLNNYSVAVVGNDLVLRNILKSDTYLNSAYTLATKEILDDGTYIEGGLNAFSNADEAAANLGGQKYTLTVTGGEIASDIKLGGANFVLEDGSVDGTIYACVNTADKGGFYTGKTYTVMTGSVGGFDLTAGEGVYVATNSKINFGETVTVNGNIIGGGDTIVTTDGNLTVNGLIMGVTELVLDSDGFITASGIDLGSGEGESTVAGTIRVNPVAGSITEGNRRLLIQTETDIRNVQFAEVAGGTVYSTGKQVYFLDLSRIYFDPTFTADVDGKQVGEDTLLWNVNAFSSLNDAVAAAKKNGATLYIQNGNGNVSMTGTPIVDIVVSGSTIPTMEYGLSGGQNAGDDHDVHVVIKNSVIANNNSYIMGQGSWNSRNTFSGTFTLDVTDSVISGGRLRLGTFFNSGNKTYIINITDTEMRGDMNILEDSPFGDNDSVTVNLTGVTAPVTKWWTFFDGYPNEGAGTINVNIKDSVLGDTSNGFRFALQRDNGTSNQFNGTHVTFTVENTTVNGSLQIEKVAGRDITFNDAATATLNVIGDNYVRYALKFKEVNIAAGATITGSTMSLRSGGVINVDVTGYEGPTKDIVWMSTTLGGDLGEVTGLKEGYLVVKGSKAIVISDGNITNLYVDANYDSSITGSTSSAGDILIFVDDASSAGDADHANALSDLEEAKAKLTAGNKLFVAASENELYGTLEDEDVTPFVNLVVTNGDFSVEDSIIAAANVDESKTVTGNSVIEIAGGSIGKAAVTHVDEETGEVIVDEPAVYAKISGTRAAVGGTSDLVISKVGGIYADVEDFDTMTVTSESRVHGTVTVDALDIDSTGFLTVDGTLDTNSIYIATAGYEGASKKVLVSDLLETISVDAIKVDEGGEYFLDRENKTLWLVSTAPGNVYFNTGYTDDINGTTFNGDLLFLNTNAFTTASKDIIANRATSANTVYFLDGNFGAEALDLSGIGTRKLEFQGGSIGDVTVDAGSTVSVTGTTSAVTIASLSGAPVGEGELIQQGYGVTLKPANATNIASIDGVNYFRFNAANNANITVGKVDFLENGGQFIVDFADYTIGDAAQATLFTAANGVNNFIQYVTPEEGEAYSRTVMETRNNGESLMVYYDETSKSVIAVKRGNAGILDANANNSVNGTTKVVGEVSNTLVYGFNVSESLTTVVNGLSDGDTLVVDGANRDLMADGKELNAIITNSRIGNLQLGRTNGSERFGNFNVLVDGSTITARTAFAGRGNSDTDRKNITFGVYDEESGEYVGVSTFTLKNGAYNDSGSTDNVLCITQNANVRGDTVNVNLEDFTISCDVQMFNNIWNNNGQLKEVNVNWTNVNSTASKWMWIWDPREANATSINLTIKDSTLVSGNRDYTLGLFGNDASNWSGKATVSISGFTMTGRLSGARGVNNGDVDVAATDDAVRTLVIDGNNDVDLVKMFNAIEIADTGYLTGGTVSLVENNNTGILILGEAGKDYGLYKTFINVSNSINNATGVKFVDKTDKETEIAGYTAVLGSTNVFVYKPGQLGDVFYSKQYDVSVNGRAIKNADGSDTVLVFGDNAVNKVADAYTALAAAGEGAVFQIQGANDTNLYTNGYKTLVNGGNITTLFGGNAPDTTGETPVAAAPVASVDITVNAGASVKNLTVADALSSVTGNAVITIADGVGITGTIDGGEAYVGGKSDLVFAGAATAGTIVGFDTVTLNANDIVALTGTFTGAAITIDAADFTDFTKKVLTAKDITVPADGITIINAGANTFGYQIVNDGENKALLITSDLVKDTYADATWTPESQLGFVGDTALVFDKNAFNSAAAAAAKVTEGNVLYIEGGVFSADAVTLANNNDVVVNGAAQIGALTTGGKLTANKALTVTSIDGVSNVAMVAGEAITVANGVALAADAKISIDVTGYKPTADDVVVLSTTAGITIDKEGEATVIDNSVLTVTGEGAGSYFAYYDTDDSSVHLLKLNTFYLSSRWEGGNNMPEFFEFTGEKLIYNVNAYDRMNASGAKLVDGQKFWAYYRNGSIHTGGPDMPAGQDGKHLSEVHVYNSVVDRIVIGGTNGDQVYNGNSHTFIEGSTIATSADDSWLVSRVVSSDANGNAPYSHRNNLYGDVDVDITNSTIGAAGNSNTVFVLDNARIRNIAATETTEAKKSALNVNIKDSRVYSNINFLGDTPMGGEEDFSVFNINVEKVTVTGSTWAIRQGGTGTEVPEGMEADDPSLASTVTVNVKDSTFDANSRFGIDFNYGTWGTPWNSPSSSADYVFNLSNATFNGYLVAGRVDLGATEADEDPELPAFIGDRVLNVNGSNYVKNAYYFKTVNLTGDSSLQGDTLHMYDGGKINVDLTGYAGPSRVITALNFKYDDDGNITGGGIENFSMANLTVTGNDAPEGEEPAYKVLTDFDAETNTISKIVVKGGIKDVFVNSTYNEDDFEFGTAYKTGEAMFYGENAFSVMAGYEDPETGDVVPGALDKALTIDGTILHITGGAVETETLLNNSITVDAGATLAYQGNTCITVNGTIQNDGNFVIDASGFVVGSPDRVTVLVADEILGNDIRVTTKAYAVEKTVNEVTGKTEIALVLKASDVFVSSAWSSLDPGTEVVIDGTTAYVGYTAFASADAALTKVNTNGTITVIDSEVAFTNAVARGITVIADATSKISNTTIGSDTNGALVLQAGAVGSGLNLQGASTLTVNAGAKVTGGLGMSATASALFDNEATLDFYIVGQNKIEGPRVTNLSSIGASTPKFTVTIDAGIKDGAYQLASGAAAFNSSITLQTEAQTYVDLTLGNRVLVDEFGAYFEIAIDDNNVLTLKKEASQDVIYVNSTWTDGQTVTIDGATVTVGENGFTTGDAAAAKAASSGATSIKVVGGTASFTDGVVITTLVQNAELADTNVTGTLTVSETSTLSGTFAFAPAEGKTITVNGTVAFDTVNTTAAIAQITDLSKATFGESAKFTLKVTGEVQSGDVFLLATGAEGFASTVSLVGSDVVLTVGETQKVGNLGYRLTLTDGNLALNITDKPVPAVVFVNSTWTANDGDTVVISDTVSATMGYDAFKNGNAAYSAVAADGEVVVLGGTVNFSSAIEKNLTINDGAKLVGKNAFAAGKTITVNGTVVFDTQYAATVQISGLANTTGTAKFELVDTVSAAGDYLLASDAAGFTATVKFGDNDLTVGGPVVEIDDLNYTLAINDNNDLVLSVTKDEPPAPVAPTQTYANSEWSSLTTGAVVAVTGGTAIIGTDAFATLSAAISAASDDGKINVTGGTVTFANGYSKTVTVDAAATVVGKAAFNTAITINGTFMFDTTVATATAAQITGFNLISGDAKFALTDAASGTDTKTYRLASDVVSFNKSITVEGQALTLEQGVKVGDYDYSLALEAGNLTLTVAYVEPPTPTEFVTKSDIDGNGISDVLFVWTGNNYQQGYWMNGTATWQSANAAHPSDWIPLGAHDMNNNGKADSVMFGNVWTETSGKGAYIGYYIDADDASTVEHPTWQNIGYLNNEEDVTWQNCVGNLNGEKNSIVWYAPDLYATGIWVGVDEYPEWIPLSASFGGPDWNLVGCGDFDGDGKQSVVMNYNNGQFLYSVDIDGNTKSLGDLQWIGWQLRAIGDFAGDGKDDIVLFHEETGTMVMCYDGNIDNYAAIGQLAFDDWFVVGAGDYNGDKKDDLLVRQYSTGMLGYYSTGDTNQWVELGRGVDMQWTVIA